MPETFASQEHNDNVQLLLLYCHHTVQEGCFIQQSLPNVEPGAVKHSILQLQAVHAILAKFSDPWLTPQEINNIIIRVSAPLQIWLDTPCPAYHPSTKSTPGGGEAIPNMTWILIVLSSSTTWSFPGNKWQRP